jgi:hypothetical protein
MRPSVPATFSRLERFEDDEGNEQWRVGNAIGIGAGMTFFRGTGIYHKPADPNQKATLDIEPALFGGIGGTIGARQLPDATGAAFSGNIAVYFGFQNLGGMVGWDIAGKGPFIGVSAKIEAFKLEANGRNDLCIIREAF